MHAYACFLSHPLIPCSAWGLCPQEGHRQMWALDLGPESAQSAVQCYQLRPPTLPSKMCGHSWPCVVLDSPNCIRSPSSPTPTQELQGKEPLHAQVSGLQLSPSVWPNLDSQEQGGVSKSSRPASCSQLAQALSLNTKLRVETRWLLLRREPWMAGECILCCEAGGYGSPPRKSSWTQVDTETMGRRRRPVWETQPYQPGGPN